MPPGAPAPPQSPIKCSSAQLEPTFFARFRGFCTVFGFSLFGRVGVIPGLVNGTAASVGDAGA